MIGKLILTLAVVQGALANSRGIFNDDARCPTQDSFYLLPHENDCGKFYLCAFGKKYTEAWSCMIGSEFSKELQSCVDPSEANCQLGGNPSQTTSAPNVTASTTTNATWTTTTTAALNTTWAPNVTTTAAPNATNTTWFPTTTAAPNTTWAPNVTTTAAPNVTNTTWFPTTTAAPNTTWAPNVTTTAAPNDTTSTTRSPRPRPPYPPPRPYPPGPRDINAEPTVLDTDKEALEDQNSFWNLINFF